MPVIVKSRVRDITQETNKILSEMPHEKRRSIRKLIETLNSSGPIAEYLISDPGAFTWERPVFGSEVEIWACGGGPGGGSGRKGAAASFRGAGGVGTDSVPFFFGRFPLETFPKAISGTIGTGGAGGASQATNSTNGLAGSAGTNTTVDFGGGRVFTATASTTTGAAGTGVGITTIVQANNQINPVSVFRFNLTSGTGGGIDPGNNIVLPGEAARLLFLSAPVTGANGVAQDSAASFSYLAAEPRAGTSSLTGDAQKGGDGVLGLSGRGGGAAVDSVGNSGAGGRGGDGFVYIRVYA